MGWLKGTITLPDPPYGLTNGIVGAQSERHNIDPCDTNYGRFWALQKANINDQWSYWGNTQPWSWNDPNYHTWISGDKTQFQSLHN